MVGGPYATPRPMDAAMPRHSRAPSRVAGIDAGRVMATFAIVWVHTSEIQGIPAQWSALGRFGTSFYIVSAVLMSARPLFLGRVTDGPTVLRKRAKRLLIPFLLWSVVYAAFYFGTMLPQGYQVAEVTRYWGLLTGTAPHLWFLPFAFVASAATAFTVPVLLRWKTERLLVLLVGLVLGAYALSYGLLLPELDRQALTRLRLVRLGRWIEELPLLLGALAGVALYGRSLGILERLGRKRRRRLALLCAFLLVVTQIAYFFLLEPLRQRFWTEIRIFANVSGALWLIVCVAERNSSLIKRFAPLGRATYFAFLAHQLVLDLTKRTLSQLPGHGSLGFALGSSMGIFAVSATLGWYAPRIRGLRWLVP